MHFILLYTCKHFLLNVMFQATCNIKYILRISFTKKPYCFDKTLHIIRVSTIQEIKKDYLKKGSPLPTHPSTRGFTMCSGGGGPEGVALCLELRLRAGWSWWLSVMKLSVCLLHSRRLWLSSSSNHPSLLSNPLHLPDASTTTDPS